MISETLHSADEISRSRTSSHAWCVDKCYQDKVVESIRDRIMDITGISYANYENLQLLKYEVGQVR